MNKKKELVKNTFIIFLGKFSTQFLTFFLLPLYTKFLDSSDYGTIDLIMTYVTLFVPIITIQYEMGTFRYLIDNRKNKTKQYEIIYNSLTFFLRLIVFCLMISIVISLFIDIKNFYLIIFCIISMMLSNLFMQIARGLGKNIDYSISCFFIGLMNIIFNIILIIPLKMGGTSILISSGISNLVGTLFLFVRLMLFKCIKREYKNKEVSRKILKYSWPLVPNTISWWLINASDRTIVTWLISSAANGIYSISTKFSAIISSILNIFNLSWTESASLHIDDDDRDEFFSGVNDQILRLMSSMCILLISFMPILFIIFINKKYIAAYQYIPINIVASFFNCIVSVYSSIYVAKKMTKQVAMTSFLAAVINIGVDFCLIKFIGLYAASISTAVAYIVMAIYRSIDLRKFVKIKYDKKLILIIVIFFITSILFYYQDNVFFKIINMFIAIVYLIVINRHLLFAVKKKIIRKP
jgi:O-antigen/teichoic acid export membrane protein